MRTRVGIISDTHGLLRSAALRALGGADQIIHAGDIGDRSILDELARIAPVTAVRGNTDREPWTQTLPATEVLEVDSATFYVLHDLEELDLDPAAAGFQAVITGHTHRPAASTHGDVLYLNPGSAGPRRFQLPITLALVEVGPAGLDHRFVELVEEAGP